MGEAERVEQAVTPIQAIHSSITITEALERYAGAKINGRQYRNKMQIRCPFHQDNSPSMTVYLDSNKCRCWKGGCIANSHPNDQIDVVQMAEGISRQEAIHRLLTDLGINTGKDSKIAIEEAQRRAAIDADCREALKAIQKLKDELDFSFMDVFRKQYKPIDWGSDAMADEVTGTYSRFYDRLQIAGFNLEAAENEQEKRSALRAAGQITKEVKQVG
ncbi:CHC2 zinc finger domain-containing protein [Sporolactobacillus putidus]|uniref:Zinc finger CHC2-type domain-containing protein n=1 Tax=Sporolactobacillus putidus TaxID=492735 RepID=A0A917S598_9BACL|nr:CHC2 zinc finger domain-containing protein [Sporolactobacillus putidus]GGL58050.1 hypothetical protein GCM10007968_22540 [Sporolactobacillus putidus]